MAKVSTIKFNMNGKDYAVHVNCNSSGQFKANLPDEVSERLKLDKTIQANTLSAVEKDFNAAIEKYKAAQTTQELLIAIRYGANGRFSEKENGDSLFALRSPHEISISFSNKNESVLLFDFKVLCRETVDTASTLYETKLGKDFPDWSDGSNKEQLKHPNDYFKSDNDKFYGDDDEWKLIPFSRAALESLVTAQNKIRAVSEILYKFISQDEKQIEYTLTKTKLLQ